MDRISNLPDEIICHIGSFLSAKEAAFTTVFSRRWRNLFTIIPKLCFSGSVNDGGSFKDFVDEVLSLPANSRVREFSLKCKHVAQCDDLINRCLREVVKRGVLVLEVQIEVDRKGRYSLPFEVFTCRTVAEMKLGSGFTIDFLPADALLPALKKLFLDSVRFHGLGRRCTFKRLLSASPVLEELVMDGIDQDRRRWSCTVSSPTLKRLTVRLDSRGFAYDFDSISLDTPGLTYLEYSDYVPKVYLIVNLDSLVEVKLSLWADQEDVNNFDPMNLINGLKNVEVLDLTIATVELFAAFHEAVPVFEKVFQLTLRVSDLCWYSVPKVMKKFPHLKTLINEGPLHIEYEEDQLVCDCVSQYSFLLSCPVEVLKIKQYDGSIEQLEQMKHFLEKLQCLELVEVQAQVSTDKKLQVVEDLLMLPRASSRCRIKVKFCGSRY